MPIVVHGRSEKPHQTSDSRNLGQMQVTRFLHRNAVFLSLAILLLSILVFGTQYMLRVSAGGPGYLPLAAFHAVTTGLWCMLLVAQGLLVRRGRLGTHRSLGRISYLLAPVVAFSIFWLSLDVLRYDGIDEGSLYILFVTSSASDADRADIGIDDVGHHGLSFLCGVA